MHLSNTNSASELLQRLVSTGVTQNSWKKEQNNTKSREWIDVAGLTRVPW